MTSQNLCNFMSSKGGGDDQYKCESKNTISDTCVAYFISKVIFIHEPKQRIHSHIKYIKCKNSHENMGEHMICK